ncbi:MAG: regulator [Rhodospirillaceae bacterium]|jgi:regulatory protein|uniref:regulatory protein RecX n=1 Tax=unclassified Hwanghaeella TaxID=2605944 RepID=UPI000C375C3E|nr:regulator [Rhodospirillales bacterium]MAX48144.1 regulator [Rhodospirillaceae bacterium]|tara:strand:+ start:1139 stop:1774 length:636 start_codon:yes stop_codon:yes gene_type:complete
MDEKNSIARNTAAKDRKSAGGKQSGPKPVTPERLGKIALHYLERYASSAENLRRVLMRRVLRSAQLHGTDSQALADSVDDLIQRYQSSGLLDDTAYALGRSASLHRQGKSTRAIQQTLSVKGVDGDTVGVALEALREEVGPDLDLRAAVQYARRRRLGPWRRDGREEAREKDLAALGRQGFGYDIARHVIGAETPQQLEDELDTSVEEPQN